MILNKLLEDLNQFSKPIQSLNTSNRYDVLINKLGGIDVVRDLILAGLNRDLLQLLQIKDLSFDVLEKLKETSRISYRPGVYLHVIYNNDLKNIGLYVGSAEKLKERITGHKKSQISLRQRTRSGAPKRKTKTEATPFHQRFWASEGYRNFWLVLAELGPLKSMEEINDSRLLLSILEKILALLFRTLPQQKVRLALPTGAIINPYSWIGLNIADPLKPI